jgi:hypothetical protein
MQIGGEGHRSVPRAVGGSVAFGLGPWSISNEARHGDRASSQVSLFFGTIYQIKAQGASYKRSVLNADSLKCYVKEFFHFVPFYKSILMAKTI